MNNGNQLQTIIKNDNYFNINRPIRVLIAEDNEINSEIINRFLQILPSKIDNAVNGKIAVELFTSNDYDFIIMDMRMPIMDGYEATKAIREIEKNRDNGNVTIFALSASATTEEVQKSFESGCNEHLSKPIKKAVLFEMMLKYYNSIKQNSKLKN